jgi:hypothetical protein
MCLTRRAKHLYKVIIARTIDARAVTGRGLFVFGRDGQLAGEIARFSC